MYVDRKMGTAVVRDTNMSLGLKLPRGELRRVGLELDAGASAKNYVIIELGDLGRKNNLSAAPRCLGLRHQARSISA